MKESTLGAFFFRGSFLLFELKPAFFAGSVHQRGSGATGRAGGLLAFGGASVVGKSVFLIEQALPSCVHHGHDLGQVLLFDAYVDARCTAMAVTTATFLAIQDGGDPFGQAGL